MIHYQEPAWIRIMMLAHQRGAVRPQGHFIGRTCGSHREFRHAH